ncbi:hypothetical protein [Mesorhizobium sp. AR07]|nr:hypothetical protein [Mesorhizobium sp. AR07]
MTNWTKTTTVSGQRAIAGPEKERRNPEPGTQVNKQQNREQSS